MPQINLMQPGQPVANFSVDGAVVVVAGVSVDAAAVQEDASVLVEIRHNGESAQIGGTGAYLAHIEVPPAQYSDPVTDTETGEVVIPAARIPLDPNSIKITLWPTA